MAEHIPPSDACHRKLIVLSNAIEQIPDESTSRDQFTTTDELFSRAIQYHLRGELNYALQLFEQIKQVNPNYPGIESNIRAARSELKEPYFNRYGEIEPDKLLRYYPRPEPCLPRASPPMARNVQYRRVSCTVIVVGVIVLIVIIILLWRFLPFFQ